MESSEFYFNIKTSFHVFILFIGNPYAFLELSRDIIFSEYNNNLSEAVKGFHRKVLPVSKCKFQNYNYCSVI